MSLAKERCLEHGPGYATPLEAMDGPKEKIIYVTCVQPNTGDGRTDYLAVVDVDPESGNYGQVISRVHATNSGDEFHHMGWNTCSRFVI